MLTNVAVEKASGNPLLDLESRRAVLATAADAAAAGSVHAADPYRLSSLRVQALMTHTRFFTALFAAGAVLALTAQTPTQPPAAPADAAA